MFRQTYTVYSIFVKSRRKFWECPLLFSSLRRCETRKQC